MLTRLKPMKKHRYEDGSIYYTEEDLTAKFKLLYQDAKIQLDENKHLSIDNIKDFKISYNEMLTNRNVKEVFAKSKSYEDFKYSDNTTIAFFYKYLIQVERDFLLLKSTKYSKTSKSIFLLTGIINLLACALYIILLIFGVKTMILGYADVKSIISIFIIITAAGFCCAFIFNRLYWKSLHKNNILSVRQCEERFLLIDKKIKDNRISIFKS